MHGVLKIAVIAAISSGSLTGPAPRAEPQVPDRTMKDLSAIVAAMDHWPALCGPNGCVKPVSCQDPNDENNSLMIVLNNKRLAILDFQKSDHFTLDVDDSHSLSVTQINDDGTIVPLDVDSSVMGLFALDATVARSCIESAKLPAQPNPSGHSI